MKPRTLHTTKLLAVALTAAAGLSEAAHAAPLPRFRPLRDADGYPLPGNVIRKGGSENEEANLAALRDELLATPRDAALANRGRFAPLCAPDGKAKVTDTDRKGQGFQPSEFCREIRKKPAAPRG